MRVLLVIIMVFLSACTTTQVKENDGPVDPNNPFYNPNAAKYNAEMSLRYYNSGHLQRAMEKSVKAMKQDPNLPEAFYAAALVQQKVGDLEVAEKFYRRAIELQPFFSQAHQDYAVLLCKQKRYAESDIHFEQALKDFNYAKPDQIYLYAANCALLANNTAKAEVNFRKVLEVNPFSYVALYEMAKLKYHQKDYLAARAFLERLLGVLAKTNKAPNSGILYLGYQIETALKDKKQAVAYRDFLTKNFPSSEEAQKVR